jgi:sugar transferase EpsL
MDELPELFNVLRGDLSLVGPRPLLMQYLPLYSEEQMRRHDVMPGITGWAQIHGRNNISWEEKFNLDLWYVDHRSFCLDLKILWQTLVKVFRRENISMEGEATTKFFEGNN